MINFCIFTFIVYASKDSAKAILFGSRDKTRGRARQKARKKAYARVKREIAAG